MHKQPYSFFLDYRNESLKLLEQNLKSEYQLDVWICKYKNNFHSIDYQILKTTLSNKNLNCKTHIIEIDIIRFHESGLYAAQNADCTSIALYKFCLSLINSPKIIFLPFTISPKNIFPWSEIESYYTNKYSRDYYDIFKLS